ncbi:Mate efflux family protein [uncultured Woeseiaceae bacterium]|uniref:Multidrug-efflux transporter n=1 Tax=uncultured Woeseiaceae bacterium TaxID=1983305 RepID=A0A7D9D1Q0_9GAMM|nr:Mate efflux family protein [uncultured Woeseiaceae bacterium]
MASPQARLTHGSVGRHLVDMAVPVLFGIFTMMGQAFADMWFIGRVGDRELAALSFAFPILMIVTSVAIGLGAGTSSVVARAIGAHNHRRARRLATDSLILSFGITAMVSALGFFTIEPLFTLLGAPAEMIPLIAGYMTILYAGVPFVVVGMVGMSSMRATGDTRLPSMLMVIASVANVILDPILIFGFGPVPAMGLNGAAMAALLSRAAIFAGTLYFMRMRLDLLTFNKPDPGELRSSWADVLHVGIPAAATNAIIPIATGVITAMLARYGPEAVAGFGVASRVESLTLVLFYALSAVIGPFVGQNIAAGRADRIFEALRLCMLFCVGTGLAVAVLLALSGEWLPTLFSDNPEVTKVSTLYLMIAPISYGAYGMVMIMNASFNGMGKPMPAVHISVSRMALIYVPLAFVANRFFGITGIFVAYAFANIVSGVIAYIWARASVQEQCDIHAEPLIVAETV